MATAGPGGAYCPVCRQSYPATVGHCSNDGTRLVKIEVQHDALVGRVLDARYEVRALIAEGGRASIYRGWQLSVDREVAIKVVRPAITQDPAIADRLVETGRLACQLSGPSIVNVYDFGKTEDGIVYLVMELLRGRTLADEAKPLPARRVVSIAIQICDALAAAQALGVLHGGLVPRNVMLIDETARRDTVKILDFGLATAIGDAGDLGHAHYRAPEQIEHGAVDARADLYAVGCILYELLTGGPPFAGATAESVHAKHLRVPPPKLPPNVPLPLADAIGRLLVKSAGKRLGSHGELRRALEPLHTPTATPPFGIAGEARTSGTMPVAGSPSQVLQAPSGTWQAPSQITQPPSGIPPAPVAPSGILQAPSGILQAPSGILQAPSGILQAPGIMQARARGGIGRLVVIAVVAIVVSGGGLLAYWLATQ